MLFDLTVLTNNFFSISWGNPAVPTPSAKQTAVDKSHQNAGDSELPTQGCSAWQTLVPRARCTTLSRDVTLYTVPNAPEPRTLIFLNSVSFKILKRAWLGASPLGVSGSTSCEEGSRPELSARPSTICDMYAFRVRAASCWQHAAMPYCKALNTHVQKEPCTPFLQNIVIYRRNPRLLMQVFNKTAIF